MTPATGKPDSASDRQVALRARPDLEIHPQQNGSERLWVVKDPVALTYFQLREEEHAILEMLDGRTSFAQLKQRFEERFAPLKMGAEQLQAFLGRLHQSGLVLAEAPGQAAQLLLRHDRGRRRALGQFLANLLAIRFRGVDPDAFLNWLHPRCRWLFSTWFLACCLLLALAAAALVVVEFETLRLRLPDFHTFFNARNLVWLAVALSVAKVLHELGHALTTRHFGGHCHEIGILLLVFTPCLYCNVSDAWLLSSKWQRIAVSAAGIVVELMLATVCTFLWWFSQPGLFHTLCLSVMCVCSVNTLLFNGNPLLRYDGYYILSDWLQVPNLGQQARAVTARWLAGLCLGLDLPAQRWVAPRQRSLLISYEVASTLYRWSVVLLILWFCHRFLKPYGLAVLAQGLALVVIAGMVAMPLWIFVAFWRNPLYQRRIRRGRALLSCLFFVTVVAGLALVPVPYRVSAPVVLQPADAHYVYVPVPGILVKTTPPGTVVGRDQELARLVNLDVRKEIVDLTGQRNQQARQLEDLRLRLASDPSVASQIPAAEESLADMEARLRQRQDDEKRLILRTPVPGTVLPPPARPSGPFTPGRLDTWRQTPLEARNLGCRLETGALFCLVGEPAHLEALLVIDQADMRFVRKGQHVRMQLDELPGTILGGTIAEIARTDLKVVPRELAVGSDLLVRVDEEGTAHPLETSYQARVTLDRGDWHLLTGARGRAKIVADPQPLGQRLYRYLGHTFNFQM